VKFGAARGGQTQAAPGKTTRSTSCSIDARFARSSRSHKPGGEGDGMARPGLKSHPKFRRLVHLLREPVPHVWGYLECLWEVAYQSGDPVIGDALDIELAAEYPGEPGKLCQALLDCRLLDQLEDGRIQIHDLHENAPEYVKKRFVRDKARRNKYSPRNRPDSGISPPKSEFGGLIPPNSANGRRSAELGAPPSPAQPSKNPPNPPFGGREASQQKILA
jgi:hypothetical protein